MNPTNASESCWMVSRRQYQKKIVDPVKQMNNTDALYLCSIHITACTASSVSASNQLPNMRTCPRSSELTKVIEAHSPSLLLLSSPHDASRRAHGLSRVCLVAKITSAKRKSYVRSIRGLNKRYAFGYRHRWSFRGLRTRIPLRACISYIISTRKKR